MWMVDVLGAFASETPLGSGCGYGAGSFCLGKKRGRESLDYVLVPLAT